MSACGSGDRNSSYLQAYKAPSARARTTTRSFYARDTEIAVIAAMPTLRSADRSKFRNSSIGAASDIQLSEASANSRRPYRIR